MILGPYIVKKIGFNMEFSVLPEAQGPFQKYQL